MNLTQKQLEKIGAYIRERLPQWMQESDAARPRSAADPVLLERIVRVEEELRHQRDLLVRGFAAMEKRFEQVDKRFEQVDKRFEQVDKRFEQVDKRFEQVDKRFEQVERRFEQFEQRFAAITVRIDRFMIWSFGLSVTLVGTVIAVLKIWK